MEPIKPGDYVRYDGPDSGPPVSAAWRRRIGKEFLVLEVGPDRLVIWEPGFPGRGYGDWFFPPWSSVTLTRQATYTEVTA